MNFGKLLTAMVTPFDSDGNIDFVNLESLVNHLINTGTDGIVVAGTTGESPTLTSEEKVKLFEYVVQVTNNRVPIIAGTGSNNTRESIDLTRRAEQAGVDGIMLVCPYYNRPSQTGLYKHFEAIAQRTKLPVMLYNIPGRSAVNMSVDTIVSLSSIKNIVSVKEASGNLTSMTKIINKTPDDFAVYSGDDDLTLPTLAIGGAGIVSVSSHIIGNEMKKMIHAYTNGNVQKAATIHQQLLPTMEAVFSAPSPTPIKAALNMKGINVGGVRLPLVPLSDQEHQVLEKALQHHHKLTL